MKPAVKRTASTEVNGNDGPSSKIRRIQPTKVGEVEKKKDEDEASGSNISVKVDDGSEENVLEEVVEKKEEPEAGPSTSQPEAAGKNTLTKELEKFIKACRAAESSTEMKQVIKTKLMKYYHSVHPDYVTSKNFLRSLKTASEEVLREPHFVYAKLKIIIDELDARRKSKATVFTSDDAVSAKGTGDEEKDAQLKVLYGALVKCKRTIADLEEAEVDWEDDDNSAYLKKVRFEKRACEIYHKVSCCRTHHQPHLQLIPFQICELTGESTHAHRIVKKPIVFKGTDFPEFNKQLQKMVNKKNEFPNFRDVLKCLDFRNKKHNFGLSPDQLKRVAQDAFEKLGKILQQRRKTDLYETTTFYVGKTKDPAKEDPELRVRLEKNKKNYAKYEDIINE